MKKSKKFLISILPSGKFDEGEKIFSGRLHDTYRVKAIEVHKPINERTMGQDPALTKGVGADFRNSLEKLHLRYEWGF